MALDPLKLRREYQTLRSDRSDEEGVWDDIERYIMPLTGKVAQSLQAQRPETQTAEPLWDLTAPLAADHLASALHSDLTSDAVRWLDFEWTDDELEQDHEAVKYRERLAELCWAELQASDFGMEIGSGYLEWAGKGTMCLVAEPLGSGPEWKGLDFTNVPIAQTVFVEDSRGFVLRWYRHLRWTAIQCLDHCEREGADVPQRIRELAQREDAATAKLDVIFAVYRRNGWAGGVSTPDEIEGDAVAEQRPWGCCYFTLDQGELLGKEGGYYRMPVVMARYGKRAGTAWGYGRGHIALRAVKWLNGFKELARDAAEQAVDPPLGVSERVGGDVSLRPGKATVLPGKDDVWSLNPDARFDVAVEVLRDERLEVRRAFHEDDLQLKESPQMTATEVQARKDQMNRSQGSPAARLRTEALEPVAQIVLDHLGRAKRLPIAPDSVKAKKAKGATVQLKLRLRGPIARAQLMDEVVAIERSAAFIANLVKLGFTEARHELNLRGTIKEHAKRLGAPAAMFNSPAEAKKLIDAERRAIAEAQAAKTAKDQGQAIAAVAGAAGASSVPIGEQPALLPSGGVAP